MQQSINDQFKCNLETVSQMSIENKVWLESNGNLKGMSGCATTALSHHLILGKEIK